MIGGISYFHAYAYDLLATNERIMAATCDAAIDGAAAAGRSQKVTYLSSSMVFESTDHVAVRRGPGAADPPAAVVATASRSWRSSTSPGPRGTSTRLPYTIVPPVQLRRRRREAGPSATSRSPAAT